MLKSTLKLALRIFRRRPFFTFVSLFGIALTLTVLVVVVALLDQTFGAGGPEVYGDRTLRVGQVAMTGEDVSSSSPPGYKLVNRYVRTLSSAEKVSVFTAPVEVISYLEGQKIRSYLKRTDGAFWEILRFHFIEGGPFSAADEREARMVAVINATTRRRFFAGEPALGKTLEADGQRFRVVGVVDDVPLLRYSPFSDIWVPVSTAKSDGYKNELLGDFAALILARSSADFPRIKSELRGRLQGLDLPAGYNHFKAWADTPFESFAREVLGDARTDESVDLAARMKALLALLAALFMLLPVVNLVNVNVSRILERASEIGVRKAFGASARHLVAQFVLENVILTLLGAALALAISQLILSGINAVGLIPYAQLHLNGAVLVYSTCIAIGFGAASGAYPAWKMARLDPVHALKGSLR